MTPFRVVRKFSLFRLGYTSSAVCWPKKSCKMSQRAEMWHTCQVKEVLSKSSKSPAEMTSSTILWRHQLWLRCSKLFEVVCWQNEVLWRRNASSLSFFMELAYKYKIWYRQRKIIDFRENMTSQQWKMQQEIGYTRYWNRIHLAKCYSGLNLVSR